jgi:hypothetical protein
MTTRAANLSTFKGLDYLAGDVIIDVSKYYVNGPLLVPPRLRNFSVIAHVCSTSGLVKLRFFKKAFYWYRML